MKFIDLNTQYERLREPINARIQGVLDHGQYILGPEVAELEDALAALRARAIAYPLRAAQMPCYSRSWL